MRHCQIHLTEPHRERAAAALYPDPGYQETHGTITASRAAFTGPHFHDIKLVQVSEGTVDVFLPDGTAYMYPLHTVARIKVYETEE